MNWPEVCGDNRSFFLVLVNNLEGDVKADAENNYIQRLCSGTSWFATFPTATSQSFGAVSIQSISNLVSQYCCGCPRVKYVGNTFHGRKFASVQATYMSNRISLSDTKLILFARVLVSNWFNAQDVKPICLNGYDIVATDGLTIFLMRVNCIASGPRLDNFMHAIWCRVLFVWTDDPGFFFGHVEHMFTTKHE